MAEDAVTAVGLFLPNRVYRADEPARIVALGCTHYVGLVGYDLFTPLKRLQPDAALHGRVDIRGPLRDAGWEAERVCHIAGAHPDAATWAHRNEPNLESPGVTPAQWADWLARFGAAVKARLPGLCLHTPPVSPGTPDWLAWLDATAEALQAGCFDAMRVNAYGWPHEVELVLREVRARWDGPVLVSETNFGAGRQVDLAEYARVLPEVWQVFEWYAVDAACYFMWEWHVPDIPLPTTVNVRETILEQALATLAQGANNVGLKEQYSQVFAEWERNGGVENNFALHLIGIGVLPPTKENLTKVLQQARATLNQLELALGRLPFGQ